MLKLLTLCLALCTACSLVSGQRRNGRRRDTGIVQYGNIVPAYPNPIFRPAGTWGVPPSNGRKSGGRSNRNSRGPRNPEPLPQIVNPPPQIALRDPPPQIPYIPENITPTSDDAENVIVNVRTDGQVQQEGRGQINPTQRRRFLSRRPEDQPSVPRRRGPRRLFPSAQEPSEENDAESIDGTGAPAVEGPGDENEESNEGPRPNLFRRRLPDFGPRRGTGRFSGANQDGQEEEEEPTSQSSVPFHCDGIFNTTFGDHENTMLALLENVDNPQILRDIIGEIAMNFVEYKESN